jgi:hypothetical protein
MFKRLRTCRLWAREHSRAAAQGGWAPSFRAKCGKRPDRAQRRAQAGCHGGNVQAVARGDGFPLWVSPAEPARCTTSPPPACTRCLLSTGSPRSACPPWPTSGYEGARIGIQIPVKQPQDVSPAILAPPERVSELLSIARRALSQCLDKARELGWRVIRVRLLRGWPRATRRSLLSSPGMLAFQELKNSLDPAGVLHEGVCSEISMWLSATRFGWVSERPRHT